MFERDPRFFGVGLWTPDDIARELNGISFLAGCSTNRHEPDPLFVKGVRDTLALVAIHFGLRIVAEPQDRSSS